MKHLKTIITILTLTLFFNCEINDDVLPGPPPPLSNNEFTIGNNAYDTTDAYLLLDDGPNYTEAFALTFINGKMREDTTNGISLETSTTQGVVLWVNFSNGTVTTEQAITNRITNFTNFNLGEETTAITNIANYNNTYIYNTAQYGDPDDAGAVTYEVGTLGSGTLDMRLFTIDLVARTGTVDCTYTFVDENNNTITGAYIGTFDIINEF